MPWFNDLIDPKLIGTQVKCRICQQEHVLEHPYAASSTADKHHAYITCTKDGQRYFVGAFQDPPVLA